MFIHCQNSRCKFYWEDSCTKNLESKMVSLDNNGICFTFELGVSDYYYEEKMNKAEEMLKQITREDLPEYFIRAYNWGLELENKLAKLKKFIEEPTKY